MEEILKAAESEVVHLTEKDGASANVANWDVRAAAQIGDDDRKTLRAGHEKFAHSFAAAVGAYLRVQFDASLASTEYVASQEFLQGLPEATYLASGHVTPFGLPTLLQMDLSLAFPVIDLLLGGEGRGGALARDVTEIEDQVLEDIARIVWRELQKAWQAAAIEFHFDKRQQPAQAQRLLPPSEKLLCVTLDVALPEARGTLKLAVPAIASNVLLRKVQAAGNYQKPVVPETRERLKRALLECFCTLDLLTPTCRVSVGSLVALAPGDLVSFPRPADAAVVFMADGHPLFRGRLVRVGRQRAMRVEARIVPEQDERKRDE